MNCGAPKSKFLSMSVNPYVYIAGPFFNKAQAEIVTNIKFILDRHGLAYFSPKDECLYEPGKTTPEQVLELNLKALEKTELTICITDGKDPGTMFEAGWCHAKHIPIIYVWLGGLPGQKFNLVLAASGSVVRSYEDLDAALSEIKHSGVFVRRNWSAESVQYE